MVGISNVGQYRHEPTAEILGNGTEIVPHSVEILERRVEAANVQQVVDCRFGRARDFHVVAEIGEKRIDAAGKTADRLITNVEKYLKRIKILYKEIEKKKIEIMEN